MHQLLEECFRKGNIVSMCVVHPWYLSTLIYEVTAMTRRKYVLAVLNNMHEGGMAWILSTHTHTHMYTHAHTRTHTHMYTHAHTRTHTYAHTHTHTRTHTHTYPQWQPKLPSDGVLYQQGEQKHGGIATRNLWPQQPAVRLSLEEGRAWQAEVLRDCGQ